MSEIPLINRRIKEARISLNMTQQQVANVLKFKRAIVADIEKGKRKVSTEEFVTFSNIFGLDISYFLSLEPESTKESVLKRCYSKSLNTSDRLAIAKFRKLYYNYRKLLELKKIE
ncbi:MAG: helix-turn-helix transcriptional regulator [Candidatus Humimicrobiia bacterium]